MSLIGTGATRYAGSDAYPYTIVAVSPSGKKVTVTRDKARRTDSNGLSESQEWEITTDPDATPQEFSQRKDGHYYPVGTEMCGYGMLHIGTRRRYSDPHI